MVSNNSSFLSSNKEILSVRDSVFSKLFPLAIERTNKKEQAINKLNRLQNFKLDVLLKSFRKPKSAIDKSESKDESDRLDAEVLMESIFGFEPNKRYSKNILDLNESKAKRKL